MKILLPEHVLLIVPPELMKSNVIPNISLIFLEESLNAGNGWIQNRHRLVFLMEKHILESE
jgi:hypothetical protein